MWGARPPLIRHQPHLDPRQATSRLKLVFTCEQSPCRRYRVEAVVSFCSASQREGETASDAEYPGPPTVGGDSREELWRREYETVESRRVRRNAHRAGDARRRPALRAPCRRADPGEAAAGAVAVG